MEKKLTLNSQDVIEEKIPKESYGYSIEHVNKFLDIIAHDYEKFQEIEVQLLKKNDSVKERLHHMEQDLRKCQNAKEALKSELEEIKKGGSTDYTTVLKRIASSEQKVFQMETDINAKLEKILTLLPHNQNK